MPKPPNGLEYELFVGDLDKRIDKDTLEQFFKGYGPIFSIKIMRHAQKHTSRGFGYVVFYNGNDVKNHTKIFVYSKFNPSFIFLYVIWT